MPAWEHEIEGAKEEQVDLLNCFGPKSFTGQNGRVSEVVFKRCTCVFDDDHCFNPEYDESDLQSLPADNVILAIGQSAGPDFETFQDVPLSRGGLESDLVTYQTQREWVFAGGDAVYGPDSVVRAAASGMKAALNIDRFINGQAIEVDDDDYFDEFFKSIKPFDPNEEVRQKVEKADRKEPVMLSPETRVTNFDEIEQGFSNPDAIAEAERCLRCYRVVTLAV
jgi:NADPH-dependent glutamate synthase beta subunit-like oxidoreductase